MEIPLTLIYKLNSVCNADKILQIPVGECTKINYKMSITLHYVCVKFIYTIYRYMQRLYHKIWFVL